MTAKNNEQQIFEIPAWMRILSTILVEGGKSVQFVSTQIGMSYANTYKVIQNLVNADFLVADREGRMSRVRLTGSGKHLAVHSNQIVEWVKLK